MIRLLLEKIEGESGSGITTFLNPYSYNVMRGKQGVLSNFDCVYVDGIFLVAFLRIFLKKKVRRVSFDMTSLAPRVFEDSILLNKRVYLIGSKPDEIQSAVSEIISEFPEIDIQRYRDGYLDEIQWNEELDLIVKEAPDIVVVGMGTPLQERFLVDLKNRGWVGLGFTCGGFFHQTASSIKYYPKWMDDFNLRWLYRMYDEPKLIKRYFFEYGKFVFLFLYDLIIYKIFDRNRR